MADTLSSELRVCSFSVSMSETTILKHDCSVRTSETTLPEHKKKNALLR